MWVGNNGAELVLTLNCLILLFVEGLGLSAALAPDALGNEAL
jgi:hypothetical protein